MTEPIAQYIIAAADDAQSDARRRNLTNDALRHAGAAERALLALVAFIAAQRQLVGAGTLDDAALLTAKLTLRDLRERVEALGVGVA